MPERVVRNVFASSIDLVVHVERDVEPEHGRIRRETLEIRALAPSLHEDFSTEPLFERKQVGAPMEWTGAQPPASLTRRLERSIPEGSTLSGVMKGEVSLW